MNIEKQLINPKNDERPILSIVLAPWQTWPNCFTRSNVRPDGAPFIEAESYFMGMI